MTGLYRFGSWFWDGQPVSVRQMTSGHYRLYVEHEGHSHSLHDDDGTVLKFDTGADARHWARERGMEVVQ